MAEGFLENATKEHIALFNSCVDTGNWSPLVSTYHPDAVLEIAEARIPALHGRDAIARFYLSHPPQEHMHAVEITTAGPARTHVLFTWDSGGRAELTATWDGLSVKHARLTPKS